MITPMIAAPAMTRFVRSFSAGVTGSATSGTVFAGIGAAVAVIGGREGGMISAGSPPEGGSSNGDGK